MKTTKKEVVKAFLLDWVLLFYATLLGWHYLVNWQHSTPVLGMIIAAAALTLLFSFVWVTPARLLIAKGKKERVIAKKIWMAFTVGLLLVTVIHGWKVTGINLSELLSIDGLKGVSRIGSALLSPNLSILDKAFQALIETIFMALMATMIAIPIAFVMSFLGAHNLMTTSRTGTIVYSLVRFVLNTTRSIEPIIWAIVFSVWVGIGPFAGMLALALHSIASLTKLYSEQIESIDQGPIEAIASTGAHPLQVVWYGVVPQIVLPFLSFTIYRWDINVRMATIIGLVGGGGIGTMLIQYQGLGRWNEVGTIVVLIAAAVWAMDYASAKLRASIV